MHGAQIFCFWRERERERDNGHDNEIPIEHMIT